MENIIDLSLTIEDEMISYPSNAHQRYEYAVLGRIPIEGRATRRLTMGSHTATHIDAPKHFIPGGKSIAELPMNMLIGPAWLVNLGTLNPGAIIQKNDIESRLPAEKIDKLVIQADWDRFWNTEQYYKEWPVMTHECAAFIVESGIKLLALDFPSPDPAYFGDDRSLDCPNHKLFFENGMTMVEYLTNLKQLKPGNIFFMAMPLKLKDFDGSPARVAAYQLS